MSDEDQKNYLKEHGFPNPKIPQRSDDPLLPPQANIPKKSIKADYLSKVVRYSGETPNKANDGQPKGWEHALSNGLTKKTAWVRMHLQPEAIGGKAGGNNLVPARSQRTNLKFYDEIEEDAFTQATNKNRMIWYDAEAQFAHDDFPGFPSYIRATYGGYKKVSPDRSGHSPEDWSRDKEEDTYAQFNIEKPSDSEKTKLHINSAGEGSLRHRLGKPPIAYRVARQIAQTNPNGGRTKVLKDGKLIPVARQAYSKPEDVRKHLEKSIGKSGGLTQEEVDDVIAKIEALNAKDEIDWGVDSDSRKK
jgi:hypothetical protein